MEKSEIQQKLLIAQYSFPIGVKVCNTHIGNVGTVSGKPFHEANANCVFIPVTYREQECVEDIGSLVTIVTVKKDKSRNI